VRAVTELTATVTLFHIRYTLRGTGTVTDLVVASYLAKYSTKGTEITGHASARITPDTLDLYADPAGSNANAYSFTFRQRQDLNVHLSRRVIQNSGRQVHDLRLGKQLMDF
jgi:hypothetical protein